MGKGKSFFDLMPYIIALYGGKGQDPEVDKKTLKKVKKRFDGFDSDAYNPLTP